MCSKFKHNKLLVCAQSFTPDLSSQDTPYGLGGTSGFLAAGEGFAGGGGLGFTTDLYGGGGASRKQMCNTIV